MKILFDYQIFRAQQYGGVSRYFYEVAKRLSAANGCDVEIFAPLHINQYLLSTSGIRVLGIKIKRPPYSGYILRNINSALTKAFVSFRRNIDIFHETYFTMTDNCPRSAKRVITVHDMIHEKFAHYFPNRDTTRKNKAHAAHRADHIICVSENTRRDLIELLNVSEEKTSVVYHGHSLSCTIDSIKPANHEKPFILYVGNRGGYKNFDLMLRAFASSKLLRKELAIICFGGGKASPMEMDLAAALDLPTDCVKYMSGNDTVLAGLYASAVAFVYPSLYEGFGIPLIEAMAFGCPVICSNTGSIPEIAGNAVEYFDPEQLESIRTSLEAVLQSTERQAEMIQKGLMKSSEYSWERCANETLKIYRRILK